MLADTHCHLNFESFNVDRTAVIERALQVGVERILVPGIDLETSKSALDLAVQDECVYAAAGVHPNDASSWDENTACVLRSLLLSPKVVAVGEIGLDDYWNHTPSNLQRQLFEQQLELAAEAGLPVVVHVRDRDLAHRPALTDALTILESWQKGLRGRNEELATRPGVFHSFSGDLAAGERAIAIEFMIGIPGPVTYNKADVLKEIARHLPENYLLIETDAPFQPPHPFRGKRNEPAYVRYVAEMIAGLRGMDVENLGKITAQNAARLFDW